MVVGRSGVFARRRQSLAPSVFNAASTSGHRTSRAFLPAPNFKGRTAFTPRRLKKTRPSVAVSADSNPFPLALLDPGTLPTAHKESEASDEEGSVKYVDEEEPEVPKVERKSKKMRRSFDFPTVVMEMARRASSIRSSQTTTDFRPPQSSAPSDADISFEEIRNISPLRRSAPFRDTVQCVLCC